MSEQEKDAERYRFLRDAFALRSNDDIGEFASLAPLTGAAFDAAIDKAMEKETA